MVKPSKTLTLGRLQASLVCSRLIAFFMVLDSLDQLHRVAESRLSDLISDAKVHINNMQNKLFFDLFQIYFASKIANIWNPAIYKRQTLKNTLKNPLFSWKHLTQICRFFLLASRWRLIIILVCFCAFSPNYSRAAEITAICFDEYFKWWDYYVLSLSEQYAQNKLHRRSYASTQLHSCISNRWSCKIYWHIYYII